MRKLLCIALLVAGLFECVKMFTEIDLTGNLGGDWETVSPDGVHDAGLVIWKFTADNEDPHF